MITINQLWFIKIQPNTKDFWGINSTNTVVIPQNLVLRSFVLGWIFLYRNWSLGATVTLHDMAWHDMMWRDMTLRDLTWYDLIWHEIIKRVQQTQTQCQANQHSKRNKSNFSAFVIFFFKCVFSNLYYVLLLTISFYEAPKGLVPRGNFLEVRHVAQMMVKGHKRIFGIAHYINVAWRSSFIVALGNHVILKMSFKHSWGRKGAKHLLYWFHVVQGVRKRSERQNHSFDKRHSFIQSTLTNFTVVNYLPYYFRSPIWTCNDTYT